MPDQIQMPKGWRSVRLGDVASIRRDLLQPLGNVTVPYVALEHILSGGMLSGYGQSGDSVSAKTKFRKGDTLYGKLRPNLRKAVRAGFEGVCSTEILAVFAKNPEDGRFLSQLLRSDLLHKHTMKGITGTKMPRTSWNHLQTFTFGSPPPVGAAGDRCCAGLHRRSHRGGRGGHRRPPSNCATPCSTNC